MSYKWQALWLVTFLSYILTGIGSIVFILTIAWNQTFDLDSIILAIGLVVSCLFLVKINTSLTEKADKELELEEGYE